METNKPLHIEQIIREIKPQFKNWGFGIQKSQRKLLCNKYGEKIIGLIYPSFKSENNAEAFYCKNEDALKQIENDWLKIKEILDKTKEDISFMKISLEEYFPKIALEFYSYTEFSHEDILHTYQNL